MLLQPFEIKANDDLQQRTQPERHQRLVNDHGFSRSVLPPIPVLIEDWCADFRCPREKAPGGVFAERPVAKTDIARIPSNFYPYYLRREDLVQRLFFCSRYLSDPGLFISVLEK